MLVRLARFPHLKKALSPMVVTLAGIFMLVRFVQPKKAYAPMDVIFSPISTD